MVQLLRSLAEESRRSVPALEAAAGAADHEDMARHKGLQVYVGADCCVDDNCRDDHIDLQLAEARKERLASRQERHQQVLHFEWHTLKLPGHRSARSAAPQASVQHNK